MASPIPRTWTWASLERQWGAGRAGMLQSTGLQIVRHNLPTEQQAQLIYNVVLVSAVQRQESALSIHAPPPSWAALTPSHPTPQGHHRAPGWAPCAPRGFPLAIYFTHSSIYIYTQTYMCVCTYVCQWCSQFVPPSPSPTVLTVYSLPLHLYSFPSITFSPHIFFHTSNWLPPFRGVVAIW